MYDPKCHELANYFLPTGIPGNITEELAQLIQTTIEDFMNYGEHSAKIAELEEQEHG